MRIIDNNTKNIRLYYALDGVECYLQLRSDYSSVTLGTGEVLTLSFVPISTQTLNLIIRHTHYI